MIRSSRRPITPDISNYIEKIDDTTVKQVCKTCGGKGYYIHQWADYETKKVYKSEWVNCDQCEGGFIYGKKG